MAIVTRTGPRGTRYQAMYRNSLGVQKSAGTFDTKKEARAAYTKARARVLSGIDLAPMTEVSAPAIRNGQLTVQGFAARWIEDHPLSDHSRGVYRSILKFHVLPRFGGEMVSGVRTYDVATWIRKLEADDSSASLMAKIKTVTSALFQAAAEEGLIDINPVRGIKLAGHETKRRKALTPAQFDAVAKRIPERYQLLIDTVIEASVLLEELTALTADDIAGNQIYIGSVLNELSGPHRYVYRNRTKTKKSRTVQVSSELAERLLAAARHTHDRSMCGTNCPENFICLEPDGRHISRHAFRKNAWLPALESAGLSGFVPRDLRRTSATWMREAGAKLESVQKRLGHGALTTTIIYLAEASDTEDEAAAALQRYRKK